MEGGRPISGGRGGGGAPGYTGFAWGVKSRGGSSGVGNPGATVFRGARGGGGKPSLGGMEGGEQVVF